MFVSLLPIFIANAILTKQTDRFTPNMNDDRPRLNLFRRVVLGSSSSSSAHFFLEMHFPRGRGGGGGGARADNDEQETAIVRRPKDDGKKQLICEKRLFCRTFCWYFENFK